MAGIDVRVDVRIDVRIDVSHRARLIPLYLGLLGVQSILLVQNTRIQEVIVVQSVSRRRTSMREFVGGAVGQL